MKGLLWSVRAARPSLLDGIASMFDFGDTLADPEYAPAFETDTDALRYDWAMLEHDFVRLVENRDRAQALHIGSMVGAVREPRNPGKTDRSYSPDPVSVEAQRRSVMVRIAKQVPIKRSVAKRRVPR